MRTPALTLTLIGMQVSLLEEWQVHREAIYLSVAQQAQVLQEGLTSVLELFRASVQDQAALEALVEQGITSESALLHTLAENLQATAMGKEALGMIDSTREALATVELQPSQRHLAALRVAATAFLARLQRRQLRCIVRWRCRLERSRESSLVQDVADVKATHSIR